MGKLKEDFLKDACSEYEKRLSRFCSLTIAQIDEQKLPENPSPSQIETALSKEADIILKKIPDGSFTFALCVEGEQISSEKFAEKLAYISANGNGKVCLIIGSSFGLSQKVKNKCDFCLSFSKMTFPHQLFRVLLLEQIYRAFSIINSMKYHK